MSAFQNYYVDTIKNRYAQFDGRASRSEFWYYQLFNLLIFAAAFALSGILGAIAGNSLAFIPMILVVLLSLGLIVPSLALAIRRLHDSDKSGWLLLCGLIPAVGGIILLVFYCLESTPGPNQFGPHPYDQDALSDAGNFNDIIDR